MGRRLFIVGLLSAAKSTTALETAYFKKATPTKMSSRIQPTICKARERLCPAKIQSTGTAANIR